jgi:tetratricopeptide (TPR) repeat protein
MDDALGRSPTPQQPPERGSLRFDTALEETTMNPFERPPMCWLLSAVKFICRRLLYVGIVIPVIAVSAFFVIPRVMQWCGPLFDPMTIVEPIQIPDSFKDRGYTEAMLQHVLVDTLSELREKAQGVTPATDTERVLTEFKLPDFSVPGTGLSVRPLIEFTRTLLKRDSSVYGSVIGSPDRFTVVLSLRDPDGHIVSLNEDGASERASRNKARIKEEPSAASEAATLRNALKQAAIAILKHQSPLLHAEYVTAAEQDRCLDRKATCDFHIARELFEALAAGAGAKNDHEHEKNAPWALLALSKLDTYAGKFDDTVRHARRIVEEGESKREWRGAQKWAYYNWGVALNDMGCYQRASEVLDKAAREMGDYAPAHNALARAYLALAQAGNAVSKETMPPNGYRTAALEHLKTAIDLNPGYQEAYVNRGDALRLPVSASEVYLMELHPGSIEQMEAGAREAYRTAVALDVESASRAYQRLAALQDEKYVSVSDRMTKARPQCRPGMARSLLESWGCSDAPAPPVTNRKGAIRQAALSVGDEQARMCSRQELALPGSATGKLPYSDGTRIVATKSGAAPLPRSTERPSPDAIRKIASGQGIG